MKRAWLVLLLCSGAANAADDVDALHARILSKLAEPRKPDEPGPVTFRLRRLPRPPWPTLVLRSVAKRGAAFVATFDGDRVEHGVGTLARGILIAAVDAESVTLEFNGERKVLAAPRQFPAISLRSIAPFRSEWMADFEGERRPYSAGEMFMGARIVRVTEKAVTLEFNGVTRTLELASRRTFPALTPAGIMRIGNDWGALFTEDPAVKRRGDAVQGARIIAIDEHGITLQFGPERRRVEYRRDRSGLLRPEWRVLPPGAER